MKTLGVLFNISELQTSQVTTTTKLQLPRVWHSARWTTPCLHPRSSPQQSALPSSPLAGQDDTEIASNKLFRWIFNNMPTFPTALRYLPTTSGWGSQPTLTTDVT